MAAELSSTVSLTDIAIGPLAVKEQILVDFDIDDLVHYLALDQAEKMKLYTRAKNADPDLARDRVPVVVGDVAVGGF